MEKVMVTSPEFLSHTYNFPPVVIIFVEQVNSAPSYSVNPILHPPSIVVTEPRWSDQVNDETLSPHNSPQCPEVIVDVFVAASKAAQRRTLMKGNIPSL